jgi:hypothetical protein
MTAPPGPTPLSHFPLSLDQAAELAGLSRADLLDFARIGGVAMLVCPLAAVPDRPPVRFDLESIRALGADTTFAHADDETRDAMTVARVLREYLARFPPVSSGKEARLSDAPMLAHDRAGELRAHVRLPVVLMFIGMSVPRVAGALRVRQPDVLREALIRLGCVEVRGMRSVGDARVTDHNAWWRLPLSMWSVSGTYGEQWSDWPVLAAMPSGMSGEVESDGA